MINAVLNSHIRSIRIQSKYMTSSKHLNLPPIQKIAKIIMFIRFSIFSFYFMNK